jgi:hypothetical protein
MLINSRFRRVDYIILSVLSDLNKFKYLGDRGDRVYNVYKLHMFTEQTVTTNFVDKLFNTCRI